jgi:hypothetical protein
MIVPELSASKVAGFIGLHKYQSPEELQYELLLKDKTVREKIQALEREHGRRSFTGLLNEVYREQPVADCIGGGIRAANKTADVATVLEDVESQARLILDLRRETLPPDVRDRIAAEIRGKVSKGRGIQNENAILNQYELQRDVKVTERNTKTFRKDYGSFKLVGRTDGYVASELIERFPDGQVRHTKYLNDPAKWGSLRTAIDAGVTKLNAVADEDDALKRVVFANTVCVEYGGAPDVRRSARLSGAASLTGV